MPFSLDSKINLPKKKFPFAKRFPVLLPIVVLVILILGYSLLSNEIKPPTIGVIQIEGVILESEPVIRKIRMLEENPSVKGIIVRINSPGGAVSPSQEIFSELLRIKAKKKIYTSISSSAASGGYYIAVGTEKIFANPGSMVGSIGVIIQTVNVEELMKKIGIRTETIKSGKNKDIGSSFREMTPGERKLLENVILDTHEQFVTAVADNRPLEIEKVRQIADGRIFTGRQAFEIGMIDGLASFRETVEKLRLDMGIKEEVQLFYPTEKDEIIQSIMNLQSFFNINKIISHTGLFFLGPSFFQ